MLTHMERYLSGYVMTGNMLKGVKGERYCNNFINI